MRLEAGLHEDNDIVPKSNRNLSPQDKRRKLKAVYTRILNGTPYKDSLPMFLQLIDQVPEGYLDYELDIDMDKAIKMIDELVGGSGMLTSRELGNLGNIIAGIGVPAITKYATGDEKINKEIAKFGAEGMNSNIDQFLTSLEKRRDPSKQIETREVDVVRKPVETGEPGRGVARPRLDIARLFNMSSIEKKNSKFWKLASKIASTSRGLNAERIARSVENIMNTTSSYQEAAKKATELGYNEALFSDMYKEAMKNKKTEEVEK
jgi:hypothetical protein